MSDLPIERVPLIGPDESGMTGELAKAVIVAKGWSLDTDQLALRLVEALSIIDYALPVVAYVDSDRNVGEGPPPPFERAHRSNAEMRGFLDG